MREDWSPVRYEAKSENGWALAVYYRAAQDGWVFQCVKGPKFHFCGIRHKTPLEAQQAAVAWAAAR